MYDEVCVHSLYQFHFFLYVTVVVHYTFVRTEMYRRKYNEK